MRNDRRRIELGRYIVADPKACHGGVTFKGTRIFVADVLADAERGLSWEFIVQRWGSGRLSGSFHKSGHVFLSGQCILGW